MLSSGLLHHMCGHALTCTCTHTLMHACTYTHTHVHALKHMCAHTYTRARMRTHTHFFKKNELVYVFTFDDSERTVLLLLSLQCSVNLLKTFKKR